MLSFMSHFRRLLKRFPKITYGILILRDIHQYGPCSQSYHQTIASIQPALPKPPNDVAAKIGDWSWTMGSARLVGAPLSAHSRSVLHLQVVSRQLLQIKMVGNHGDQILDMPIDSGTCCNHLEQMILSPDTSGHLAFTTAES